MDAKRALEIVNDASESPEWRLEAAAGLAEWIRRGGGIPDGLTVTDEAIATLRDDGGALLPSLRVAVVYGDTSGLVAEATS